MAELSAESALADPAQNAATAAASAPATMPPCSGPERTLRAKMVACQLAATVNPVIDNGTIATSLKTAVFVE